MPWFNFPPIQLRDGSLCVDCPHFCEDPQDYQICLAVPKPRNRIYCAHLDQQTMKFSYVGEKDKRPLWCPIKEHDLGVCAEKHKEEMGELHRKATEKVGW